MADGVRKQFLSGQWDATGELIAGIDAVRAAAARIPYTTGFKA
jgi:hypothetical protein